MQYDILRSNVLAFSNSRYKNKNKNETCFGGMRFLTYVLSSPRTLGGEERGKEATLRRHVVAFPRWLTVVAESPFVYTAMIDMNLKK